MIAVPALDLRGGRCVQLVGGRPEEERVSLPDPVSVARNWAAVGFEALHIVDLDAALGSGDNLPVISELLADSEADCQVGGGIRSDERIEALLDAGCERVVVGTRALDDPEWFRSLVERHPGRIMIALDTRDGVILRKGWTESTQRPIAEYLPTLADLPLAGVLSTDVGREGRLAGIDAEGCRAVVAASPHPVWISGGVTTLEDLAVLEDIGTLGVVLGMTIYAGTINVSEVAARWGRLTPNDTRFDNERKS